MSYTAVKKDDPQWAFYSVTEWDFWEIMLGIKGEGQSSTQEIHAHLCMFSFTLKLHTGHSDHSNESLTKK